MLRWGEVLETSLAVKCRLTLRNLPTIGYCGKLPWAGLRPVQVIMRKSSGEWPEGTPEPYRQLAQVQSSPAGNAGLLCCSFWLCMQTCQCRNCNVCSTSGCNPSCGTLFTAMHACCLHIVLTAFIPFSMLQDCMSNSPTSRPIRPTFAEAEQRCRKMTEAAAAGKLIASQARCNSSDDSGSNSSRGLQEHPTL